MMPLGDPTLLVFGKLLLSALLGIAIGTERALVAQQAHARRPVPHLLDAEVRPARVSIPLKQHVGVPAAATVRVGQRVRRGDVVGDVPEEALGVPVHASIDGTVTALGDCVEISAEAA